MLKKSERARYITIICAECVKQKFNLDYEESITKPNI